MDRDMVDVADKLACFQAITGIEDPDLCSGILSAHGWDLQQAISTFTAPNSDENPSASTTTTTTATTAVAGGGTGHSDTDSQLVARGAAAPVLAWKIITLPISVISGGLGLISGAIGRGMWAAGAVLSYSLSMLRLNSNPNGESSPTPLVSVSTAASEAAEFVADFERDYGAAAAARPNFVAEGFMDALERSERECSVLFVYLHSPDHQDTPLFCERTLCSEALAAFVNENFVAWGASIRSSEGFKMSDSFKASQFPFCAVVMAAGHQRIALLKQIEGPKSPEEMLTMLQRVLEDSIPSLLITRLDTEERRNSTLLREEQDAAYLAALEADQARERQRKEEQERLAREAAEAERKRKEEEEALERAAREAVEKEAALARMRQEKAQSLGAEPEKGPDVTQVRVRFPTGELMGRRFHCSTKIQALYDFVDALGCLEVESYSLISNFPRVVYGPDKLSLSLKEAGLHPQASLFVELN